MENRKCTLILGATGKTGRRIVQRLEMKGVLVRCGSRQATPAFDWQNSEAWPELLAGVRSVYISFFPDLAIPEAVVAIERFVACSKQAGVEHIVLLSGRGEAGAQRCENVVRKSGIKWTIVRCSWFAQSFSEGHLLEPVLSGTIALPAGDVAEPFIDIDDIADVVVAALTDPGHIGQLYEMTGPRLLSFSDVAKQLSEATGREIVYVPISLDRYREEMTPHVGADIAGLLTELFSEILDGRNACLGDGVQRALGRPATDFSEYIRKASSTSVWKR